MLGYGRLDIRLLARGPRLLVDDRPVDAGSPQAALSLAVLSDKVGHPVHKSALVDALWDGAPPRTAVETLHSLMSRLRRKLRDAGLPAEALVSRGPGYVLDVDPRCVDWRRARLLLDDARRRADTGRRPEAALLFDEALALWDGDPLALVDGAWARARRADMRALRLRVLAGWAHNALELGDHAELLYRLEDHPLHEPLVLLRMRALAELGRGTEAAEAFTVLREHLRRTGGVEPNTQTRRLHERLLRDEVPAPRTEPPGERRPPPAAPPAPEAAPGPVPAPAPAVIDTLPNDLGDFTGRERELRLLLDDAEHTGTGTAVHVVRGLAGVGKTALALHAAHRMRDRFDIRLHIDLRGIDTGQALSRLLLALGVPGEAVPQTLDRRVEMWRTATADRRVLLVLDDAVRGRIAPLIPASPGGVALVTIRKNPVLELDGARDLQLRSPSDDEGLRMLAAFAHRPAEDDGMAPLASLLGNLPLALRLTAGQLRRHPARGAGAHAERILRNGLSEIEGTERRLTVVFDMSYADLSPVARRVFLCAGLHPVADLRLSAVAAAFGGLREAEAAFEELLDVHLVEETADGVFRMHDLVRRYAGERARQEMAEPERRAVELRVLDHYLHTADAADRAALPGRFRPDPPMIGRPAGEAFAGPKEARDWFVEAFAELDAVVAFARERGYTAHLAWLPLVMAGLLESCGPWNEAERSLGLALEAWRSLGGEEGAAHVLYERGRIRCRLLDLDRAQADVVAASTWWETADDARGIAYSRDLIGSVHASARRYGEALREHRFALSGVLALGDRWGQALVHNHIGVALRRGGDFEGATRAFTTTASISEELGDDRARAQAILNEAAVLLHMGLHRGARRNCEESLRIFEAAGDPMNASLAHNNLGVVLNYLRRHREALDCFNGARERYRSLNYELGVLRADAGAAEALLGLGCAVEAREVLEAALPRARRNPWLAELEPVLLNLLGEVHAELRLFSAARHQHQNARLQARSRGNSGTEGLAWDHLGDLCAQEGDIGAARDCWRESLRLLAPLKVHQVSMVAIKLDVSFFAL
ncbi:BTAD domain-containing putative transcriptional regulator [Nocardiopsis flavescens]|uniref:AfsR/SARP family transcriptional regulator n=1 Tax=Nocardiopsis flavescens TaxID=758803 RepID=UPI003655D1A1